MKSASQVRRAIKDLRAIVEDPARDKIDQRIAYVMESALRWALGTAGNYNIGRDALDNAECARVEQRL